MSNYWTVGASEKDFYVVGASDYTIPPYTERQIKANLEAYTVKGCDIKPDFDGGIHRLVIVGV